MSARPIDNERSYSFSTLSSSQLGTSCCGKNVKNENDWNQSRDRNLLRTTPHDTTRESHVRTNIPRVQNSRPTERATAGGSDLRCALPDFEKKMLSEPAARGD